MKRYEIPMIVVTVPHDDEDTSEHQSGWDRGGYKDFKFR